MSKSDTAPIFLSTHQHIDAILAHWNLLWPLPHAERVARINEIAADLEYDDQLAAVAVAVQEDFLIQQEKRKSHNRAGLLINIAGLAFVGLMIWEMIR